MTRALEDAGPEVESQRPSLLPFDPADLVALRVRPAQFARMCGVSKTTVSRWIEAGKIALGPDGLLDPAIASRRVLETTAPARLRARMFRHATESQKALRARVLDLELKVKGIELATRNQCSDAQGRRFSLFVDAICARFAELRDAYESPTDGKLQEALERLLWEVDGNVPEDYPFGDVDEEEGIDDNS